MQISVLIFLVIQLVLSWSPTNSYKPGLVNCPNGRSSLLRKANELRKDERDWISQRDKITRPALIDWLQRANMTDFDPSRFLSNKTLRVGLAFSGGGYRAMLSGAGAFAALDNRTHNSTNHSHLGGLVQASTYFTGLSGGNWLLGSIVLNNFTSIQELQASKDIWDLEHSIFNPGGLNILRTASYYDGISDAVQSKKENYNTSLTDIWGRALSRQFIDLPEGGPSLTWTQIRHYNEFTSHSMPFPIVVADGRALNSQIVSLNSTVFEFTPYELGSWDPSLYSFTDLEYIGTNVSGGVPQNNSCTAGMDNAGFVMGTSSSLFNQFLLRLNSSGVTGKLYKLSQSLLTELSEDSDDIAVYGPNPFYKTPYANNEVTNDRYLDLVDGGEDNQNIPLTPLIQPPRQVDTIFAFDNSADTEYNWPNGGSLVASYQRQFVAQGNRTIFPHVPDINSFVNKGLTLRPTFFGCHASNFSSLYNQSTPRSERHVPPLIIYIANSAYSALTNYSTLKMTYSQDEVASTIESLYEVVTQGNGTVDPEWPACIGCAIIQRELERRNQSQTDQCKKCFQRYCWDGSTDTQNVSASSSNFNQTAKTTHKRSVASLNSWSTGLMVAVLSLTFSLVL